MPTLVDFAVELLGSVLDLVRIFLFEVALADPIGLVVFLVGGGLTTAALGAFGYFAAGAALRAVGLNDPTPRRRPQPERPDE